MARREAIGGRGAQGLPFSKAWRAGDLVFVSGQVGLDASGRLVADGIEAQTRQVLRNIETVLAEAGCSLSDIVKTTVWLAEVGDFAAFNRVYAEFFPADPPARSTVRADLMIDARIEIEAVACKPR